MKFDMSATTLTTLSQRTQGSGDELGALVKQLVAAAAPLEGRFNGSGRAAFDRFKMRADEVAADMNSALHAILGGQQGMDRAFHSGDAEMADESHRAEGSANFDAAKFRGV